MEFNSAGIDETRHIQNRIRKADAAMFFLKSIGMNALGYDPNACIRLYKAFVRPGLEYGLTLMGNLSLTLDKLRLCQKRGICGLLGVDTNSRIDVIDAASGCPDFSVRRKVLQCRRDRSIRQLWHSPSSDDFALTFTIRGLAGDAAIAPNPDDQIPVAQIISRIMISEYVNPVSESIAKNSDDSLSYATLRRLMAFPSPVGSRRLLLLWCLSKWKHFRPTVCQICGGNFNLQDRIAECSGITLKLLFDGSLDRLAVSFPPPIPPRSLKPTFPPSPIYTAQRITA